MRLISWLLVVVGALMFLCDFYEGTKLWRLGVLCLVAGGAIIGVRALFRGLHSLIS